MSKLRFERVRSDSHGEYKGEVVVRVSRETKHSLTGMQVAASLRLQQGLQKSLRGKASMVLQRHHITFIAV